MPYQFSERALCVLMLFLTTGCSQSSQRFKAFGDGGDMAFVLDSKTGFTCATGFGFLEQKGRFGNTPLLDTGKGAFVPFCADLYSNEGRVVKDFNSYLQRPEKKETKN
jgi:hypothetical protein